MKGNTLNVNGQLLSLEHARVMGILNLTPDSFFADSRKQTAQAVATQVERMLSEGADIIDVGACSTRPGASEVSMEEEWNRLVQGLKVLREVAPEAVVSVDTYRAEIALRCVEQYGVAIINDISGGAADPAMFSTIARLHTPYILMHARGNVETMHLPYTYDDLIKEIFVWFAKQVNALRSLGVHDIILDPGFGFSKTVEQNYELFAHLDEFSMFELPLLAGISRKSMLWKELGITPEEALNGTTALHALALAQGVDILRVHDVKEAVETVRLFEKVRKYQQTK